MWNRCTAVYSRCNGFKAHVLLYTLSLERRGGLRPGLTERVCRPFDVNDGRRGPRWGGGRMPGGRWLTKWLPMPPLFSQIEPLWIRRGICLLLAVKRGRCVEAARLFWVVAWATPASVHGFAILRTFRTNWRFSGFGRQGLSGPAST